MFGHFSKLWMERLNIVKVIALVTGKGKDMQNEHAEVLISLSQNTFKVNTETLA